MSGKITDLTAIGAIDRATDLLEIVDFSANASNNVSINNLIGISGGNVLSTTDTQTVQNKVLDNTNLVTLLDGAFTLQNNVDPTKRVVFSAAGITTDTTRTLTLPDTSTTLVGLTTTQTLTNKTLTNPILTLPTITNFTNAQHDHSSASQGGLISGGGGGGGGGDGVVAQIITISNGSVATTTAAIPYDDTYPDAGEGSDFSGLWSSGITITTTTTDGVLCVEMQAMLASSASPDMIIGTLLVDGSLIGMTVMPTVTNVPDMMIFKGYVSVSPGTHSAAFRCGTTNSGTITLNGSAGARKFGAPNAKSVMTLTEMTAGIF